MSHAIYQTPAIILKTKNMRESNKLVVLYTQKFGLIYCITQSIRELKSKMRYHTNRYSLVTVDLVQGRDIWRITGIHEDASAINFAGTIFYELISKFTQLLIRLCNSEESYPELWDDLDFLYRHQDLINDDNQDIYEIIFTIRTLSVLGYWDGNEPFLGDTPFAADNFDFVKNKKTLLIHTINQRLQDTQL